MKDRQHKIRILDEIFNKGNKSELKSMVSPNKSNVIIFKEQELIDNLLKGVEQPIVFLLPDNGRD